LAQEAVGVGPVTAVPSQTVVVQLLPALAVAAEQEDAPTGPITRTGQLVVVYPLPAVGLDGVQLPEGTSVVLFAVQVVVV
jgi:hypothetical protein